MPLSPDQSGTRYAEVPKVTGLKPTPLKLSQSLQGIVFNNQALKCNRNSTIIDLPSKYHTKQQFTPVTSQAQQALPQFSKTIPEVFSEKMTSEQLELWLNHHMYLEGTDYHKDIAKLKGRLSYFCTFLKYYQG